MSSVPPGSRNSRKTQIGFVTSRSGDKSVKVTIAYKTPHPLYHKVVNRQTVLHVHDELVCEVPEVMKVDLAARMKDVPWAAGLPLAVAVFETTRYHKD